MALLAHKSSMPMSAGIGSGDSARDYMSNSTHHRTPLTSTSHNNTFASPTESEFSEAFEGPDSVR